MIIAHASSPLSWPEIEDMLKASDTLALNPKVVHSLGPLELAYQLAEKSFKNKKNLAKQFKFEFLLWLSGTRDIQNALQKLGAKNPNEMLLVIFEKNNSIIKKLKAKKKKLALKKQATWQELEKIALSRI